MTVIFRRHWFTIAIGIGLVGLALLILRPQLDGLRIGGQQTPPSESFAAEYWAMEGYDPARTRFVDTALTLPLGHTRVIHVSGDTQYGSPPAVRDRLVLAEVGDQLQAIDRETGEQVWTYDHQGSYISPAVLESQVIIRVENSQEGHIAALDLATGASDWTWTPRRLSSAETGYLGGHLTSPVVVENSLLVGAGKEVYAINVQDGEPIWTFTTADFIASSPAESDSRVFIADLGRLYCLDLETGAELWSLPTGQSIYFAPVISGQTVLVSDGGAVRALDSRSGEEQWVYQTDAEHVFPAAANHELAFAKSPTTLYALNMHTGQEAWRFDDQNFVSLPLVTQDTVFTVTGQAAGTALAIIDIHSGDAQWIPLEGLAPTPPVLSEDVLYVKTTEGELLGLYH